MTSRRDERTGVERIIKGREREGRGDRIITLSFIGDSPLFTSLLFNAGPLNGPETTIAASFQGNLSMNMYLQK